jgi:phenylalanyl-tRNA synthetase beta chain
MNFSYFCIDIINKIKRINKKIIKNVIIFDIFEGNQLPQNKKSIAFKVRLQPQEKMLKNDTRPSFWTAEKLMPRL